MHSAHSEQIFHLTYPLAIKRVLHHTDKSMSQNEAKPKEIPLISLKNLSYNLFASDCVMIDHFSLFRLLQDSKSWNIHQPLV